MKTKIGHFIIVHLSIASLNFFKENLSQNFGLIAVFVKVAVEITKRAQHCVLPRFTCFHVFSKTRKSTAVWPREDKPLSSLGLADCRMYKGNLQNG